MLSALLVPSAAAAFSGAPASPLLRPSHRRRAPFYNAQETTDGWGRVVPTAERVVQEEVVKEIDPIDIQILQQQLQAVRNLKRVEDDVMIGGQLRTDILDDDSSKEPGFRRLFTHETWARYTGEAPLARWRRNMVYWRFSSVTRAVIPLCLWVFAFSLAVTTALPAFAPGFAKRAASMWIALSLQGTAIGLLMVFRTNEAYRRLAEAREQWGKLLMLLREVSTKASVSLPYDATCEVARYLCAFTWSLRDKLRDGDTRDDILSTLLPPAECAWVLSQRSRPLAILSRIRRLLYAEHDSGVLSAHMHYFLETDVKEIDAVVESCERLFSSPIPPNMARHGMRSLTIWLLGLPIVLCTAMPPLIVSLWTAATAYIYFGIDELGAQVEQPFQIMPLWQLCHLGSSMVEETLSTPELPLRLNRQSLATPNPLSCSSGNPFGDSYDDDYD